MGCCDHRYAPLGSIKGTTFCELLNSCCPLMCGYIPKSKLLFRKSYCGCVCVCFQYHLCSPMTRALLLSTYIKFVNLFPEIKPQIQEVFKQHSNLRSADAELQQRASEYLQLSIVASTDVLVCDIHSSSMLLFVHVLFIGIVSSAINS